MRSAATGYDAIRNPISALQVLFSATAPPPFAAHPELNDGMRAVIVDWVLATHAAHRQAPETLFLAVALLDRYAAATAGLRATELSVSAACALWVASKHEEPWKHEIALAGARTRRECAGG